MNVKEKARTFIEEHIPNEQRSFDYDDTHILVEAAREFRSPAEKQALLDALVARTGLDQPTEWDLWLTTDHHLEMNLLLAAQAAFPAYVVRLTRQTSEWRHYKAFLRSSGELIPILAFSQSKTTFALAEDQRQVAQALLEIRDRLPLLDQYDLQVLFRDVHEMLAQRK